MSDRFLCERKKKKRRLEKKMFFFGFFFGGGEKKQRGKGIFDLLRAPRARDFGRAERELCCFTGKKRNACGFSHHYLSCGKRKGKERAGRFCEKLRKTSLPFMFGEKINHTGPISTNRKKKRRLSRSVPDLSKKKKKKGAQNVTEKKRATLERALSGKGRKRKKTETGLLQESCEKRER